MNRFQFLTQVITIFLLVNLILSDAAVLAKRSTSDSTNSLSFNNLDEIQSQPSYNHNRDYLQNYNNNQNKAILGVLLNLLIDSVDKQVDKMAEADEQEEKASLRKIMENSFFVCKSKNPFLKDFNFQYFLILKKKIIDQKRLMNSDVNRSSKINLYLNIF